MLQAINDKAKGLVGGIIILFISIPFALWGIQEYVGGAEQPYAAKVNDVEITMRDYEEAVARQRQRLQSMFGGELPNDQAFENRIKQQVVEQLITQRVLEQMTISTGYMVSDSELARQIQNMEAFQQDGKFAVSIYENMLRSQGMSPSEFEYLFRRDLMVQQLQNGITKSSIVDNNSLALIDRLQKQTRDVSFLQFDQSVYLSKVELTEEEINQYFNENQSRYMHPEKVSIAYVELKADDLAIDAPVDEEELRRQYDDYVARIADTEQRKARHILIQLNADDDEATRNNKKQKIQDALDKIKAGESFEALAKTVSEDPGSAAQGGDLDWVAKGMMVPAFEDALFKLDKGEVSDIVTSSFGYHIIRLDDIKADKPEDFETKKAELVTLLQQEVIDNAFYERSELMATLAYENDQTLQPVAESLGVNIATTDLFTRVSGQGIAANDKVRQAAFSTAVLKEGRNTDVIELAENHIVVFRIDQHQPSKTKSLDEVRPQVELSLKAITAKQLAQADALQALADLESGKPIVDVAQINKGELKQLGNIDRNHSSVDKRIVSNAFQMHKSDADKAVYKLVDLSNAVVVVAVNKVTEAEASSAKAEELAAIQRQMQSVVSNQEMTAIMDYLKAQSEIIKSKDLL